MLVAIAIPVFTAQLERSREATDIANIRSAYAAAETAALGGSYGSSSTAITDGLKLYYDPSSGDLTTTDSDWFKGTTTGTGTQKIAGGIEYDSSKDYSSFEMTFAGTAAPYTVTFTLK